MIFFSIIIPAYNRGHLIGLTLASFIQQNYDKSRYEIIVADNNSTDNTAEVVKEFARKSEVTIQYMLEVQQGVHYARNSAAKLAKGEILYYTDDDMVADRELLTELEIILKSDPTIGVATGKVIPQWQQEPPLWVKKYCNNYLLSLSNLGENIIISNKDIGVFSCHQAIRRALFFKSGGFNPENTKGEWIGDGETGLNIKIMQLGHKFAYTPRSVIYHIIPPARMTQEYLNKRLKNQGNCDSYTEVRNRGFNKIQLLKNQAKYLKLLCYELYRLNKNRYRGVEQWHLNRARMSYFVSRIKYDLRLIYDKDFRRMVFKYDWLNEPE